MIRGDYKKGFTLIEMMVVLALIAIIVTLSTPLSNVYRQNQVATQVHEFVSTLNMARNEAVSRGASVSICIPVAGVDAQGNPITVCDTSGTASQNWANGWIVFVDSNANCTIDTNADPALDDTVISQHNAMPNGFTFQSAANNCINYNAQGITPVTNGMWTLNDPSGMNAFIRGINISLSGRVQVHDCQNNTHINLSCP